MNFKSIIVHPGIFHADDVCVVAYLRLLGWHAPVERKIPTGDELADPDVLVADVGGQYDPRLNNFDHHQALESRWDTGVTYAAFGRVYDSYQPDSWSVADRFLTRVVLPVDAADTAWGDEGESRPQLSFSACVAGFNPKAGASALERDAAFETAVKWARSVLENEMQAAHEWASAQSVVLTAKTALDGRVLLLDKFVPWNEHVFEHDGIDRLLYVVFPSERGGFCVQQVPTKPGGREGRKSLPLAWAGLRGSDLATVTGVADAEFAHPGLFIGGAKSIGGTLKLAELAIQA